MKYEQQWTDDNDVEWNIEYHMEGRFFPGRLEEPPEYPEVVIDSMTTKDGQVCEDYPEEVYNYIEERHDPFVDEGDYYEED